MRQITLFALVAVTAMALVPTHARAGQEVKDGFVGFNIAPSGDPIQSYKEIEFAGGANFVFTDTPFPLAPDATLMLSYVPHENAVGFGWGFGAVLPERIPVFGGDYAAGIGFELQNRDGFNTLRRFATLHAHSLHKWGAYPDFRVGSEQINGRSEFFFRASVNFGAKWMKQRLGR